MGAETAMGTAATRLLTHARPFPSFLKAPSGAFSLLSLKALNDAQAPVFPVYTTVLHCACYSVSLSGIVHAMLNVCFSPNESSHVCG